MTGLDRIVFARRRSPDWGALARDHEAGLPIDPVRYRPPVPVPGFPADIVACIRAWNENFPVNFFRCRQVLKDVSEATLERVEHAGILPVERLTDLPALTAGKRFLLFYFDDDDWFAPDMFHRIQALGLGPRDIAVFPLVRLADPVVTFVREHEFARVVAGRRRNFGHRFQTNNYGIPEDIALSPHLRGLEDHVLGSTYANEVGLTDVYRDEPIAATNKTPCSANTIGSLVADPAAYREFVRGYVDTLRRLEIPSELAWLRAPLARTVELFGAI